MAKLAKDYIIKDYLNLDKNLKRCSTHTNLEKMTTGAL
jgi:hypothetical protein